MLQTWLGIFHRSLKFSFSAALSCLILYSANSIFLLLLGLSTASPSTRESTTLWTDSSSLSIQVWKLMTEWWGNNRAQLACLPVLRDPCPSVLDVHLPKTIVWCIFFCYDLSISGKMVCLVPILLLAWKWKWCVWMCVSVLFNFLTRTNLSFIKLIFTFKYWHLVLWIFLFIEL